MRHPANGPLFPYRCLPITCMPSLCFARHLLPNRHATADRAPGSPKFRRSSTQISAPSESSSSLRINTQLSPCEFRCRKRNYRKIEASSKKAGRTEHNKLTPGFRLYGMPAESRTRLWRLLPLPLPLLLLLENCISDVVLSLLIFSASFFLVCGLSFNNRRISDGRGSLGVYIYDFAVKKKKKNRTAHI